MWNIIPIWARGRLFATKTKNIRKPRIPGMHGALFIRTSKDERIRGMNGWALSLLWSTTSLSRCNKLWFKDLVWCNQSHIWPDPSYCCTWWAKIAYKNCVLWCLCFVLIFIWTQPHNRLNLILIKPNLAVEASKRIWFADDFVPQKLEPGATGKSLLCLQA